MSVQDDQAREIEKALRSNAKRLPTLPLSSERLSRQDWENVRLTSDGQVITDVQNPFKPEQYLTLIWSGYGAVCTLLGGGKWEKLPKRSMPSAWKPKESSEWAGLVERIKKARADRE